jgi:hypothetical protein
MLGTRLLLPWCTNKGRCRRIERVADRLFEGEEAVLYVMGEQKRARNAATRGQTVGGPRH